jgi:two-component system sensor histidine kinase KdpD
MWTTGALIALLMARLKRRTAQLARLAEEARQLRAFGETLRDSADPAAEAGTLRELLQRLSGRQASVLVLRDERPATDDDAAVLTAGDENADERAGLWHCLRQGHALGPGTGRHAGLPDWYLPMRGRGAAFGAALLRDVQGLEPALRDAAQALADQLGIALQRATAARAQQREHDEAQAQAVRNALLAAIAHDHRTPLAVITGAASSLLEQGGRLQAAQRDKLACTIADEAARLARLTDNTLQLARLDAPGVVLACDWESAEDVAGSVRLSRRCACAWSRACRCCGATRC